MALDIIVSAFLKQASCIDMKPTFSVSASILYFSQCSLSQEEAYLVFTSYSNRSCKFKYDK